MFLIPLIEIAVTGWPYRLHDPNWRIALVSATANTSTSSLLALLLAYVIGVFAEDRLTMWLIASVSAVMVLVFVGASGAFALDALQLRAQVRPGLESRYTLTSGWALAKIFLGLLGAGVLSASAFRSARGARRASEWRGKKTPGILVTSSAPLAPAVPVSSVPSSAPVTPAASGPAS